MSRPAEWNQGTRLWVAPLSVAQFSVFVAGACLSLAFALFFRSPTLSFFPIAFMFGWTQISTPCGKAVVGALTYLSLQRATRGRWVAGVALFTVAGSLSSMIVGLSLGWVASKLVLGSAIGVLGFVIASAILAAREGGVINFALPQNCRPSIGSFKQFGFYDSAVMWGLHIGLGFSTFFNYGGPYALMGAILLHLGPGSPIAFGVSLMAVYWLGRAFSAWLAPLRLASPTETMELIREIQSSYSTNRKIHTAGLVWMTALGIWMLVKG